MTIEKLIKELNGIKMYMPDGGHPYYVIDSVIDVLKSTINCEHLPVIKGPRFIKPVSSNESHYYHQTEGWTCKHCGTQLEAVWKEKTDD